MVKRATTMYCDKCGTIQLLWPSFPEEAFFCYICKNTVKAVPDEYFENSSNNGLFLSEEMKQKLIDNLVLTSPNFDQYYFDHKEEIQNQQNIELRERSAKIEYGKAILEERGRVLNVPSVEAAIFPK